ncbi:transcriptional regulator ATRX homolog isoform X2 [Halyomorpha halys]|uniref:transcriptional regulator ATRX homolog isoform X2 n=1 Tax=Halyomorpha halys TaxID=286706 RepID=UPI0006D4E254|nr:transcriptional regulator ATRX homolog isoform X2 [Halyomorpha halys]
MVGKSYQKKTIERHPLSKSHAGVLKENEKVEYPAFKNGELPDHHFPTVKDWLNVLSNNLLSFSESLVKKVKHETNGKPFVSDTFSINDVNESLFNFFNILDSSVEALREFHAEMYDYISTWKVTLGDALTCESSDSSVEIIESNEISSSVKVVENNQSKGVESVNTNAGSEIKFGGLRIRKPSEVNKLMLEELSNEGSNSVGASNDSCKIKNPSSVTNNPEKTTSISDVEEIDNADYRPKSVKKTNKSVSNSTSTAESETTNNQTSETNISQEAVNVDISGDCITISSPLHEKVTSPQKKKSVINWDTSSDSMSDSDWLIGNKKSDNKNIEGSKKKVLKKKVESKSTKKTTLFSSSEDEYSNLCNLESLSQKKRKRKDSDNSSSERKKDKNKSKRSKVKANLPSLLSLTNDDLSGDSDSPADDDIFTLNVDKYTKFKESDMFKTEDFLKSDIEERSLSVISDSSLDSIVNELQKTCEVKRKTSEKQKSAKKTHNLSENKKKRGRRKRDRLLDEKLTDTGSSEAEEKWEKHKMKKRIQSSDSEVEREEEDVKEPVHKTPKKNNKKPRKSLFSDSDEKLSDSDSDSAKENEESDEESESELKPADKKKRKRIQRHSDSSDSDGEPTPSKSADGKGRKNIRKVLKEESLEKSTKEALKEEEERKKRIQEKQDLYNELIKKASEHVEVLQELVLDFDVETKKPLVSVDYDLVRKLKPHQAQGIKFMWDSCFESVKEAKKNKGSGCILAHCMGLGKTLQVISLVHTLLTCKEVDVNKVLVVCPFSTVQNWVNEFHKWLKDVGSGEDIEIYNMIKTAPNHRSYQLRDWERTGGVMVLGYNLFRSLAAPKGRQKASIKKTIQETLLDPGPDVVICDEGHILKNEKTAISVVMNKLATRRRIVLTGTPLQNNLVEYHCMVQFVKPNLLGTRKEFQNRFVHPITNGQFEDSTTHDVKLMKRRAHVLHKMLDGIVQRKDYNVLTPYLPPKYEYVIHVKLTEIQCKLYKHYLENFARTQKNEGGGLFTDFQHLMRICTHPRALMIHSDKEMLKIDKEEEDSEGSIRDFIDDDSEESSSSHESSSSKSSASSHDSAKKAPRKRVTRAQRAAGEVSEEEEEELPVKRTEWWANIVSEEELEAIKSSSKLFLFFTILKHCEEIGDKLLVFSQSLYTLDLIEYFLDKVDENNRRNEADKNPGLSEFSSNWDKGIDYFRLDGGTNSDCRSNWCKIFNSRSNTRGRLFLISTKAGGLGINLTGANRVIIFDASWNPSFDVQSIFRVYRFGQDKPCYIYRFLSKGTMEEKIYERQVAKLSTSLRVIDEQQIDRHFSQTSLAELYAFNPDPPENRETPVLPKDRLMAELIQAVPDVILTYHQHDSLLENQEEEELNEEERRAAWLEFENEKNHVPPPMTSYNMMPNMNMNYLNQYRTGLKFDTMQFAMEYNNLLNILVQKVKMGNPTMPEDAVRKRAAEILTQQNIMQSLIQQQQQQMSMMAGWPNQNPALVNLPLRPFNAPPVMNNMNNVPKRTAPVNPVATDNDANKGKEKDKPQLIEIQDDE